MGGIFNPPASLAGFRNLLDNGNFAINQRGYASGAGLSSGQYCFDRWFNPGAASASYAFTASGIDTILTLSGNYVGQKIEASVVVGGNYTLSWTGSASGQLFYYNGSSYVSLANGASPLTANVPANVQLLVQFTGGTLGDVQLEAGVVAAPSFERRPIGFELALSQRYYYQTTGTQFYVYQVTGYAAAAGQYMVGMLTFPTMRVTPTMGLIGAPVLTNASNFGVNPGSPSTAIIQCTSNGAGTSSAWNPQGGGFYASAEL